MAEYPQASLTGVVCRVERFFALTLARQGYALLRHYHHSTAATMFIVDDIGAMQVPVYPVKADFIDPAQIQSLFAILDSSNLRLKVLVNSVAGMRRTDARTISANHWDATLNLNLRTPL